MGKPMIVRTYLQAKKALSLDRLVVATDDQRIALVCEAAGAEVIMTSRDCENGELSEKDLKTPWSKLLGCMELYFRQH